MMTLLMTKGFDQKFREVDEFIITELVELVTLLTKRTSPYGDSVTM